MPKPFVYVTRWQTPDDFEPARRDWFRARKVPELLRLGFLSVRAYEARSFPRGCNLYEIDDLALFLRPEYRALRRNDTFVPAVAASFSYNSKTFYEQVVVVDAGGCELDPAPTLSGAALAVLYFDAGDPDAVEPWFRAAVAGRAAGVLTCRLWRQTGEHPQPTETEAEWCAVVERDATSGADDAFLKDTALALPGAAVSRADVLGKWHGAVREDVYPDAASDQVPDRLRSR